MAVFARQNSGAPHWQPMFMTLEGQQLQVNLTEKSLALGIMQEGPEPLNSTEYSLALCGD